MKGLKTITISILVVGMLAGSAVGVAAQDGEATSFPITIGPPVDEDSGEVPVEAADQRASGVMTVEHNFVDLFTEPSTSHTILRSGVRLANDGGAWVGSSLYVHALDFAALDCPAEVECYIDTAGVMYELAGEGGYDGLTMFIVDQPEGAHLGIIVPTASVPTQPDPPPAG